MSHFSTMVVTLPGGKDVEELLAPYDEDIQVDRYWRPEADSLLEFWPVKGWIAEGKLSAEPSAEDVLSLYKNEYGTADGDDENFRVVDGRIEQETTYNPDSKWDYYRTGGRWGGSLTVKAGVTPTPVATGWDSPEEVPERGTDVARKDEIDFGRMRREAEEAATRTWEKYSSVAASYDVEGTFTFDEMWESAEAEAATGDARRALGDAARKAYWDQPLIMALKEADVIGFFGATFDDFKGQTLETFVERARNAAVPAYAYLSEETGWLEPGQMGWWGMSSDTEESRVAYHAKVNELIDNLPDDAVITIVDCHI